MILKKTSKIFILFFLISFLIVTYFFLNKYNYLLYEHGVKFFSLKDSFDKDIPLIPSFVWIYFLYFVVILSPIPIILEDTYFFIQTVVSYFLTYSIGFAFFLNYHIRMIRPSFHALDLSQKALHFIYINDHGFNVFPSMHVANTVLVALIFIGYNKKVGIFFSMLALLISMSTLFIKQHYCLDVIAGFIEALFIYIIIFRSKEIYKRFKKI